MVTTLRDALYNTHEDSGSSADYGRAIVVGTVAGMMAAGQSFEDAWALMSKSLPKGFRRECIPPNWECYVVVQHKGGLQYILNRQYGCLTQKPHRGFSIEGAVETWVGYSVLSTPDWAKSQPTSEFTAYWMY
jgi:hypothetical protein